MVPHQRLHKRNYKPWIIRNYKATEEKLKKFSNTQRDEQDSMRKFYPRVINKTNIVFPSDELLLLNKNLKYDLSYEHKNLIRTLALGAERQLLINYPDLNKSIWDIRMQIIHKST